MGISVSFSTVSLKGCSVFWGNRRIHLVGFSWLQGPSQVTLFLDGRVPRVEGDILPNCGAPSCCSWAPPLGGPWGLLPILRFPLFTTGLMQEGPSQPVLPQVQSLATCVSGSLFPEDPVAALPWFITLGPRVWAVNEPVVLDKINGFVW